MNDGMCRSVPESWRLRDLSDFDAQQPWKGIAAAFWMRYFGSESANSTTELVKNIKTETMKQDFAQGGMWSPRARGIYIAELAVFDLPATILGGYFAVLIGVESGRFFLNDAWSALSHGGIENVQRTVGSAMGIGLAFICISAICIFLRLSLDYIRGRRAALEKARQRYWRGLCCAALPLILICYGIFVSIVADSMRGLLPVLSVSLTIIIPAFHLGFALHAGGLSRKS